MNCPECDRLIYSRIHPKCGYCGAVLPPECRLSDDEIGAIKEEIAEIRKQRAIAKEIEEERKAEERKRSSDNC